MKSKAQVALEYILIITISLAIIIAALVWMQMKAGGTVETAGNRTDSVMCDIQDCENDSDCQGVGSCPASAYCTPDKTCIPY